MFPTSGKRAKDEEAGNGGIVTPDEEREAERGG